MHSWKCTAEVLKVTGNWLLYRCLPLFINMSSNISTEVGNLEPQLWSPLLWFALFRIYFKPFFHLTLSQSKKSVAPQSVVFYFIPLPSEPNCCHAEFLIKGTVALVQFLGRHPVLLMQFVIVHCAQNKTTNQSQEERLTERQLLLMHMMWAVMSPHACPYTKDLRQSQTHLCFIGHEPCIIYV